MRKLHFFLLTCLVFVIGVAASAQAAIVTVGSALAGSFPGATIGSGNTLFNLKGPANPVSPVNGAVVGWNLTGAAGGPFNLRILIPSGSSEFTGGAKSAAATPLGTGLQHFDTLLPIKAGQMVALDHMNASDKVGILGSAASEWGFFPLGPLAEGGTPAKASISPGLELGFNAEVQPAPTILSFGGTTGPLAGGTSVLITGADLEGTTAVKFGSTSAFFGQISETSLVATSPPSTSAGSVPISITTRAGTGTSSQLFTYQAPTVSPATSTTSSVAAPLSPPPATTAVVVQCKVPNLAGKHLKGARKALEAQHCKLGLVRKEAGVTAKTGSVIKQSLKPGTTKPAGALVNVKLG